MVSMPPLLAETAAEIPDIMLLLKLVITWRAG